MAGIFHLPAREAVRVKVKKCEGLFQPEYRKFSVDPQITSFEVLQSLLARAFDVKGEFAISYLARDDTGQETYFSLLSDWDLDAAFLGASNPCLRLKVDLKPFEEGLEDWDIVAPAEFPFQHGQQTKDRTTIAGSILNQMEKTLNIFQRALNLVEGQALSQQTIKPLKMPMNDAEFHNYLDSDGRLIRPNELRQSIYCGGLESGLRKVVWKHILNVYPDGLSGAERVDYMKRLSKGYYTMRDAWQKVAAPDERMQYVTSTVRKDVLRTDRTHKFYAGSDDNTNILSLYNILTTYGLNHPTVGYCQGMSDLASPLLVTMKDEAHAYVCFCALMKRLKPNFMLDGYAMTLKFQHLSEALQIYDPLFYDYLQRHGADDLLFCYRWLLLELKREFAFDDALRMLEVLWSSLPHCPPEGELELLEVAFDPEKRKPKHSTSSQSVGPPSPKPKFQNKENPYTKVRAMRRQSSSSSCSSLRSISKCSPPVSLPNDCIDAASKDKTLTLAKQSNENQSSPAGSDPTPTTSHHGCSHPIVKQSSFQEMDVPNKLLPDYLPLSTPVSRELRMDLEGLNRQLTCRPHLYGGGTADFEEMESPMTNGQPTLTEEDEGGETSTSDSEEMSTGDRIRCAESVIKKMRRKKENNTADKSERSETLAGTSEDSEVEDDPSGLLRLSGEIFENVDDDDDDVVFDASSDVLKRYKNPHLKCIVPIRLVRDSSSRMMDDGHDCHRDGQAGTSDDTDEEDNTRSKAFNQRCGTRFVSEGYSTSEDAFYSSAETQLSRKFRPGSELEDSGVACSALMTNSCEEALETMPYSLLPSSLVAINSCDDSSGHYVVPSGPMPLPAPKDLGFGNPFMIFLCLTLMLQHRDRIMKNRMDYNELAIHFDKMVRRHNVMRVLHQARALYAEYLRERSWEDTESQCSFESRDQHV